MTLLLAWLAVEQRFPSSAYIATDSRISWGKEERYDYARKVFVLKHSSDVLGYCGDVLFPSIALGQIIELADNRLLFTDDADCTMRFEAIKQKLVEQFESYPCTVDRIISAPIEIVHISRQYNDLNCFECRFLRWARGEGWSHELIDLPKRSGILCIKGSGQGDYANEFYEYQRNSSSVTSREIFQCFTHTLSSSTRLSVGGAPQLGGIISKPKSAGEQFGIIWQGKKYFGGSPVADLPSSNSVRWRNEMFELCDGDTGKKFNDAQSQPDLTNRMA